MSISTIDIHNHGYPKRFIDSIRRGDGERYGFRVATHEGREALSQADGALHVIQSKRYEHAAQLAQLATVGIDSLAFSILPHITFGACGESACVWATRCFNDAVAEIQREFPGRIYGIGMVPLPHGRAAAEELTRAAGELKLRGVQILSDIGGRELDDAEFVPFFARAEELQILVMVHPYVRSFHHSSAYYLQNLIGNPVETTRAIASLIFGGVLERFPGLKLLFAHGGGVAPYLIGRWRHGHAHREEPRAKFTGSVDEMFHRLYFDTVLYDRNVLRFLIDSAGADHILLGTDYSGDMSCWREVPELRKLDFLSEKQKIQILGENAARLLGIGESKKS